MSGILSKCDLKTHSQMLRKEEKKINVFTYFFAFLLLQRRLSTNSRLIQSWHLRVQRFIKKVGRVWHIAG